LSLLFDPPEKKNLYILQKKKGETKGSSLEIPRNKQKNPGVVNSGVHKGKTWGGAEH